MAKNDKSSSVTDLAPVPETLPGLLSDDEFGGMLSGFSSVDSVLIGDPDEGKQARYIGLLIGPGTPIEMEADQRTGEVRSMKTFAFHPMTPTGPVMNVTHVIPASYIVANACERIWAQAQTDGLDAVVGIIYDGKGKTRKGRQLNKVRIFERYQPRVKA
jgi:hypothetical protein